MAKENIKLIVVANENGAATSRWEEDETNTTTREPVSKYGKLNALARINEVVEFTVSTEDDIELEVFTLNNVVQSYNNLVRVAEAVELLELEDEEKIIKIEELFLKKEQAFAGYEMGDTEKELWSTFIQLSSRMGSNLKIKKCHTDPEIQKFEMALEDGEIDGKLLSRNRKEYFEEVTKQYPEVWGLIRKTKKKLNITNF